MLVNEVLRLFSNKNVYPNRMSFSMINSFGYLGRLYLRSIHASENVISESGNPCDQYNYHDGTFRQYIEKNSNFSSSFFEILNLRFPFDTNDSLKSLAKLRGNLENDYLRKGALDCINKEISTFGTEDFLKIIMLASNLEINETNKDFRSDMIVSLDKGLKNKTFNIDEVLEVLYVLKHNFLKGKSMKPFRFYLKFLRSFKKFYKFEPLQIAHMFYYVEKMQDDLKTDYRYHIYKNLQDSLSKFNSTELAIILSGLNRAKLYKPQKELIKNVTDKLLNEIDTVNSKILNCTSKFLKGCSSVNHNKVISNYQEQLIPHISKFNASSLIFALFSNYPHSLNPSFWDNVMEKVKGELKTLSITEFEMILNITTLFKVKNKEIINLVITAVEESEDFYNYTPHFIEFCKHLAINNIYPKKIMDRILSKDLIEKMISRSFTKELGNWAFVNCSLQIDEPEYPRVCLEESWEKKILKKVHSHLIFQSSHLNQIKSHILGLPQARFSLNQHLEKIFGSEEVTIAYSLPHFEKGVIMRFDENLNAVPVPEECKKAVSLALEPCKAPSDKHFWICMNVTFIKPEGLSPFQETYVRHLTALGYKPVLIHQKEFNHYEILGSEEMEKYLKGVIKTALQELSHEK